jgi:hypothetical protein
MIGWNVRGITRLLTALSRWPAVSDSSHCYMDSGSPNYFLQNGVFLYLGATNSKPISVLSMCQANATQTGNEVMWVKFSKAAKRQVAKAAKIAGYELTTSGKNSDGSIIYGLAVASDNPNVETLKTLMASEGAFDASWM